jgi:hypothetical protein
VLQLDPSGWPVALAELGGSGDEYLNSIAIDGREAVLIVGWTRSSDLPTIGGVQKTLRGEFDVFAAQLGVNRLPWPRKQ